MGIEGFFYRGSTNTIAITAAIAITAPKNLTRQRHPRRGKAEASLRSKKLDACAVADCALDIKHHIGERCR